MTKDLYKRLLSFILVCLLAACQKDVTGDTATPVAGAAPEILSYKFPVENPAVTISTASRKIEARFPATVLSGDGLIAEFELSAGSKAKIDGIQQVSGITPNDFGRDINYQLSNSSGSATSTWKVIATNNDHSYDWGLGYFIKKEKSNDRPYEWYYDQATTGIYSSVNCGPSSVTMAIKWADQSFSHPPEYARNFYGVNGGWWFTLDIMNYLDDNNIPQAPLALGSQPEETWNKITRQIDYGRVVILCLDANYITNAAAAAYRVDKFYGTTTNFGHFIVVKGYREVDHMKFFEVYDPNSWGQKNADDGMFKGRNRYYRYTDIFTATSRWWNYAITVNPKGVYIDAGTLRNAVDPATIPNAKGG